MLVVILIVAILLRAKDFPSYKDTEAKLQSECCACATSFSARRATLIVCGVLAIVTLALAGASDNKPCSPDDASSKLGLAAAAFGIQTFGGAIMYCFSSCGCRLCCACAPGVCNRTVQATAAIGCSLLMWWLSGILFTWIVLFLTIELANQRVDNYSSYSTRSSVPCYYNFTYVPSGLTSIAGILSAASLILHGHFVTLVPEALHNLDPPQPDGGVQPPNADSLDIQPPNAVNNQLGPGNVLPNPNLVLNVGPPVNAQQAVPNDAQQAVPDVGAV